MLARNIIMLIMMTMCAVTVAGQERPKVTVNSNGEMVIPPEMEESVRRRMELLKNPDFIRLELAPVDSKHDEGEREVKPFRVGKKINFELLMTNTLSEPFVIAVGSSYDNSRPSLMSNGATVPYHKKGVESVRNKNQLVTRIHGLSINLHPNKPQSIGTIDLSNWYERLAPGRYLLTVQYRIRGSEKWIDSSAITFEVVSK